MKKKTGLWFVLISAISISAFPDEPAVELFLQPSDQNTQPIFNHSSSSGTVTSTNIVQLAPDIELSKIKNLLIPLSENFSVEFQGVQTEITPTGSIIWEGALLEAGVSGLEPAMNQATLVEKNGQITGTVRYEGQLYQIRPLGNGVHNIEKTDDSITPPPHPDTFPQSTESLSDLNSGDMAPLSLKQNNPGFQSKESLSIIRVMVPYTPYAKSAVYDIQSLIDLAIAETNTGLRNSNIQARLELAHAFEVPEADSNSELVKNARDQYQADIVVFLQQLSSLGFAYGIAVGENSAFARVNVHYATGRYIFAHEIGHLIGALHDPVTEQRGYNFPFPYGHGYFNPDFKWRTIMSYGRPCNNCPPINYWSSPNQMYQGDILGTPNTSDAVRVWNQRAPIVARFRDGGNPGSTNSKPQAVITAKPSNKQITGAGTLELSGSLSSDDDGDALTYQWQQISPVTPKSQISSPTSTVTNVSFGETDTEITYRFRLTVRDKLTYSHAEINILHNPESDGGQCSQTDPDAKNLPLWSQGKTYIAGDKVNYNDLVWQAKWWISGEQPSNSAAWELISDTVIAWQAGKPYTQGDQVIFKGHLFEARQWTNASPGTSPGLWIDLGPYSCDA